MQNPIEDDPELARAVGLLVGRMGIAEIAVATIFQILSEAPWHKATALFATYRSAESQRDIIKWLAGSSPFLSGATVCALGKALDDFVCLYKKRSKIIHYPFGWNTGEDPPTIYKMMTAGRDGHVTKPMDAKHVKDVADRVSSLYSRLSELLHTIHTEREAPQGPPALPPQPPHPPA
jgi:hypothetical protein